jgi:hypothetical protein
MQFEHENVHRAKAGKRDHGPFHIPPEFILPVPISSLRAVLRLLAPSASRLLFFRSGHFHPNVHPRQLPNENTTLEVSLHDGMACVVVGTIAASDTIATVR